MTPPHFDYQIYRFMFEQGGRDYTSPKWSELSEHADSALTEVENLSSRCMKWSNVCDLFWLDTRQLRRSDTASKRTVSLSGPA